MTVKSYIDINCKPGDLVLLMHKGWQLGHLIIGDEFYNFMHDSVYPLRVVGAETVESETRRPIFIVEVRKGE